MYELFILMLFSISKDMQNYVTLYNILLQLDFFNLKKIYFVVMVKYYHRDMSLTLSFKCEENSGLQVTRNQSHGD